MLPIMHLQYLSCMAFVTTQLLVEKASPCGAGGGGGSAAFNSDVGVDAVDAVGGDSDFPFIPSAFAAVSESVVAKFVSNALAKVFKGDLQAQVLQSVEDAENPVECPRDLDCDFSDDCHWRNVLEDGGGLQKTYFRGNGSAGRLEWMLITGVREQPDPPFALAAANKDAGSLWLVSSPLPEQPGDGVLTMKYWTTPLIEMQVCARRPGEKELFGCSRKKTSSESPGPTEFEISGPIDEEFEIVITADNYISEPGGVAFIDEISYKSELCRKGRNRQRETTSRDKTEEITDFEKSEERKDSFQSKSVNICAALTCDFEVDECRYNLSNPVTEVKWRLQRGRTGNPVTGVRISKHGYRSEFTDQYLLANGRSSGTDDIMIVESQPFLIDQAVKISFIRWQAVQYSKLHVCIDSITNCIRTYKEISLRQWNRESLVISPEIVQNPSAVKIFFVAEGLTHTGYLAIDDVMVSSIFGDPGDICASSPDRDSPFRRRTTNLLLRSRKGLFHRRRHRNTVESRS